MKVCIPAALLGAFLLLAGCAGLQNPSRTYGAGTASVTAPVAEALPMCQRLKGYPGTLTLHNVSGRTGVLHIDLRFQSLAVPEQVRSIGGILIWKPTSQSLVPYGAREVAITDEHGRELGATYTRVPSRVVRYRGGGGRNHGDWQVPLRPVTCVHFTERALYRMDRGSWRRAPSGHQLSLYANGKKVATNLPAGSNALRGGYLSYRY